MNTTYFLPGGPLDTQVKLVLPEETIALAENQDEDPGELSSECAT